LFTVRLPGSFHVIRPPDGGTGWLFRAATDFCKHLRMFVEHGVSIAPATKATRIGPREAGVRAQMGRRLYVGNLPYSATEEQLTELFGRTGKVDNVRVMRDMATGRARGFAFVEMSTDEEAQRAISEFHEHQLEGRALVVNEARPKPEGGFGGAGRGGHGGGGGGGRFEDRDFSGGRRKEPRW